MRTKNLMACCFSLSRQGWGGEGFAANAKPEPDRGLRLTGKWMIQ
jgi:hypothetical protein